MLCAYGDATTSLRDEAARTFIRRFSELTDDELKGIFDDLAETAASHSWRPRAWPGPTTR